MIEVVNKYHLSAQEQKAAIYIGRGSPLGNPFKVKPHGPYERGETLPMYEAYLRAKISQKDPAICGELNRIWKAARQGDVRLMCFCKKKDGSGACHGDVIKKIIEERL